MMTDLAKEEDNLAPKSDHFALSSVRDTSVRISKKYILGDVAMETFCVRFDPNDKYIAAGCGDGSIKIFNVFTGK